MLFSLKDVSSKLSPSPGVDGLHTVKTNTFTLHHFESLTGMMFVLNTAPEIQGNVQNIHTMAQFLFHRDAQTNWIVTDSLPADMYQALQYIYSHLFVDYVVKNPLFKYNPDEPFSCPLFTTKLEEYLRTPNLSPKL
jgi:trafficking protein particle complex subunit 1